MEGHVHRPVLSRPDQVLSAMPSVRASVILVGSIAGWNGGGSGAELYGAAKTWIHNIQKTWVAFHTKDGVRFNTVSPGTFDTAFHADKTEAVKAQISTGIPMGASAARRMCRRASCSSLQTSPQAM